MKIVMIIHILSNKHKGTIKRRKLASSINTLELIFDGSTVP